MVNEVWSAYFQRMYAISPEERIVYTFVDGKEREVQCPIDSTPLVERDGSDFFRCYACDNSYTSIEAKVLSSEAALHLRQVRAVAAMKREELDRLENLLRAGYGRKIIKPDDASSSQTTQ